MDAIISIDEARTISLFNWGAERVFGYTADEMLGKSLDTLLPAAIRERHAGEIAHFSHSSQTARRMGERSTIVGQRKNGEIFPAEASISRYMAGGQWTFTVILRDITDRRRTEDGLRFLSEVSALLADLLNDPTALQRAAARAVPTLGDLCVIDLVDNERIVTAAVAARDPELQHRVQSYRDRVPPRWEVRTPAVHAMRTRETVLLPLGLAEWSGGGSWPEAFAGEVERVDRFGSVLVVPLVAHDRVLGSIAFTMIEGGRRHDESYRALAEEFAARIALAVDNATLYQRTRQAVGARDETLSVVSHDLRNPLSAIKMCVSALRESPAPSEETTAELLGAVGESAQLMTRIIQDLLDVASIDRGQLSLDRRPQGIGPLLERAETMFRGVADERGIALVLEHVGLQDLPELNVDGERIVQVLSNLLHNALKFTEPGGIVRLSAQRQAAGTVAVCVSDTGPGIPASELPHIFDRYWHVQRRAKVRSTGLGLAICRGIIEAHGGRIYADSVVGQGTSISFELPPFVPKS
jgi:PAS domain S-box-containing protein